MTVIDDMVLAIEKCNSIRDDHERKNNEKHGPRIFNRGRGLIFGHPTTLNSIRNLPEIQCQFTGNMFFGLQFWEEPDCPMDVVIFDGWVVYLSPKNDPIPYRPIPLLDPESYNIGWEYKISKDIDQ